MKDSLQIDDVRTMRALAHPDRFAILGFLLSARFRTATECGAEIGISPSACSYHLRELERFGLAERVDTDGDARTRPWRAAAIGFSVGTDRADATPATKAVSDAITRTELIENQRLIDRFLQVADDFDSDWRDATEFHTYELTLTPAELTRLNEQIDQLLRPFRSPVRRNAPHDAAAVRVIHQAFPRVGPK